MITLETMTNSLKKKKETMPHNPHKFAHQLLDNTLVSDYYYFLDISVSRI